MRQLVLASTSPYRRSLLERLGLPFEVSAPDIDEAPHGNESAEQLVSRLAETKARAVARNHPRALIIGSDQVAVLEGEILGKPGNHQSAMEQLNKASGKRVEFVTGLCLYDALSHRSHCSVVPYSVVFRKLSAADIEHYLVREKPYDCAGSFKSESLGIALFERLEGNDPNALIGLPLIELCRLLREHGVDVLDIPVSD